MALNENDLGLAYETTVRAALLKNEQVRGTAIVCLGHLARIHRTLPDDRAVAIVRQGLSDESEWVHGQSESAADDLEFFIPTLGSKIRSSTLTKPYSSAGCRCSHHSNVGTSRGSAIALRAEVLER